MQSSMNARYQAINFSFFLMMGSMIAFASNYLLTLGYSNAQIGMILALYSIVSFFMQPFFASFADTHPSISLQKLINGLLCMIMVASLILFASSKTFGRGLLLSMLVILIFACMMSVIPLVNAAAFMYEKFGIKINYGLARGLGSAAYAIISMILGYVLDAFSPTILPLIYFILALLTFLAVSSYHYKYSGQEKREEQYFEQQEKSKQISLLSFLKKYKSLTILLFGYMLVYITHMIINSFYIQIIEHVHGTSSNLGIAVFIAAIVELPAMFGFERLAKKINIKALLLISLLFYIAKHVVTFLSFNIWGIYLAAFLQIGAYALFTPAIVYYINQIVSAYDSLMGQTANTMFATAGGIFGSLIGGIVIDYFGISIVLALGVVLSILGTLICWVGLKK